MAVKSLTPKLELTKYNSVDMPEELNVLSEDMDKIDGYATEVDQWREETDDTLAGFRHEIDLLQPQSITALENKVNANAAAITNLTSDVNRLTDRIGSAEIDITNLQDEQGVQNNRLSAIEAEQIVQNDNISALSDEIDGLTNQVISYVDTTDARLETIERDITNLKIEDETITSQLLAHANELADHEQRIEDLEQGGIPTPVLDRIDALEANMATAQGDITQLQSDVADLNTSVGAVGDRVTATESAITNIQTDIAGIDSDITQLQSDVSANSNDINQLQSDMTTAQSDIATNAGNITTNSNNITSLQSDMTTAQGDITQLQSDVTAAQGDVTQLQSDMTQAQSDIGTNTTNIAGNASDIATLQGDMSTAQGDISQLQSDVTSLSGDVSTAQSDISDLETQAGNATLTTTAQTLSGAINELNGYSSASVNVPSEYQYGSNTPKISFHKYGRIVMVEANFAWTVRHHNSEVTLGTIPAGYEPLDAVDCDVWEKNSRNSADQIVFDFTFSPTGAIAMYVYAATDGGAFNANRWITTYISAT